MFTGLVQAVGRVAGVETRPETTRLLIDPRPWGYRPALGDSISVNGCCLTVAADPAQCGGMWAFDAVPETLSKTMLGQLRAGSAVNLEHAATASTLLGGHVVQGHVDGVGSIESVVTAGEYRIRVRPPSELMQYVVPKGSICVQGVSLTVAALEPHAWFEVALIPATLEKTTLGSLKAGESVNLEADTFAKTIVHWLKHYAQR